MPTPPTPNPNATSSTFQVGTYTSLTDTFTSVFDLNDGVTTNIMWNTLKMPQPEKAFVRSFNLRAPGERITRFQYKNRHIQVSVSLRGASVQAILNTCHQMIAAIENPPYRLRLALPNATQYSYATVVAVTHNIPSDPQTLLAKALPNVQIDFECLPGLLGNRVTLQNLVVNPGFEAPSGPGVTAFADTFANVNAYAVQAGGAPTTPAATTWVDVVTNANLARFLRLGEASGTTAFDIGGLAQHGTSANCTLGSTALVSGDTGTSYLLNGTSSKITVPTSGLPTGNSPLAFGIGFRISAIPAATVNLVSYGNSAGSTAHQNVFLSITSTGKLMCDAGGVGSITGATTITLNANHLAEVKWDGTTLSLFLDGVSQGTSTPGAQAIPASPALVLGAYITGAANFFTGNLQEFFFYSAADTNQAARWTAYSTGATGTQANTMSVPNNARVAFGSPAWGAYNTWQTRFRWVTGLSADFYLHYSDANNWLRCHLLQGTLSLQHNIAGSTTTLASSAPVLTHEAWYWLKITQFPMQPNATVGSPLIQATLFYDDNGTIGSQVTAGALGPVPSADDTTALIGRPQLSASGAALVIGGNFGGVHTVSLFGPGGWSMGGFSGTGQPSLAWEQNTANTYPNGPVTSYGAARIDLAPAGTADARWQSWDGTGGATGATQFGYPTAQGHVLGFSVVYKTTAGLSATSGVRLIFREVDSSGTELTTGTQIILSGTTSTSWATYSGTYTPSQATTAYLRIQLQVLDSTANSANATVWFDNVQLWDQTTTGQTSMPYCELRFPMGPAQLMVSGLQGDMPAPTFAALGGYFSTLWPAGSTRTVVLGRRALAHPQAGLIGYPLVHNSLLVSLDSSSYGGYNFHPNVSSTPNWGCWIDLLPSSNGTPPMSAAQGVYHLNERLQTAQTGGNLGNISGQLYAVEQSAFFSAGQYNNALVTGQLAASATPTVVDHGQLVVPFSGGGSLTDLSQRTLEAYGNWKDTTGGGSTFTFGVPWLLPVDAEVLSATLINPTNTLVGFAAPFWLWVYSDGLGAALGGASSNWLMSVEFNPLPNPSNAAGGAGTMSGSTYPSINPNASPYLMLDPQAGAALGAPGVNQMVGLFTDQSATLFPFYCELEYIPLYLYPR